MTNLFTTYRRQLSITLTGLAIGLSISTLHTKSALGQESAPLTVSAKATKGSPSNVPTADGVYLYGQSPLPNQVGQEYTVFEVNQGRVIGALYMPNAEYSCFDGTYKSGQLALMVASNAEEEGGTPTKVATASSHLVGKISSPLALTLENYHRISKVGAKDREILSACKANYQQ
jgi:hypothetical protein